MRGKGSGLPEKLLSASAGKVSAVPDKELTVPACEVCKVNVSKGQIRKLRTRRLLEASLVTTLSNAPSDETGSTHCSAVTRQRIVGAAEARDVALNRQIWVMAMGGP